MADRNGKKRMGIRYSPVLLLSLVAVAIACEDRTPTNVPPGEAYTELVQGSVDWDPRKYEDLDDAFAKTVAVVPGFAGLHFEEGQLVISLAGERPLQLTSQEVTALFDLLTWIDPFDTRLSELLPEAKLQRVRYNFAQLVDWKRRAIADLSEDDRLVTVDASESKNRVVLGFLPGSIDRSEVVARLSDVPQEAVLLAGKNRLSPYLDDIHFPLVGGLKIQMSSSTCTLTTGVIVHPNAYPDTEYGLTNSHCTDNFAQTERDYVYQPIAPFNLVGVEYFDPPAFTGGSCQPGHVCRRSDISLLAFADGDSSVEDRAVPSGVNYGGTSRKIFAGHGTRLEGDSIGKVGYATGESHGRVTDTCLYEYVEHDGQPYRLICQSRGVLQATGGDSGSPIFGPTVWYAPEVFYGALWGGSSGIIGFSPAVNIINELEKNQTWNVCFSAADSRCQ